MGKKKYDYIANKKLTNYARLKYRNQLSNGARRLYLLGIPDLEEKQSGFCTKVIASYDQIGEAACMDYSGLKKPLLELDGILCDIKIGQPIKNKKKATEICRYTLAELKKPKLKSKVVDNSPDYARELSDLLESRSFIYGEELECKPYWNPGKTGRIWSSKPNVQGDNKNKRAKMLCCGLKEDDVLFDIDIKQAEPSIIQHVLNYAFDSDPYELLAKVMGVDRKKAKPELNKLAYSKSAKNIIKHWPLKAQKVFGPYAQALDDYKAKLWESGKPPRGESRFADTLGGSRVFADKGKRTHKGQPLNWHIQGTVADILNGASLEVIQREEAEGWRFLFPVHDSFYVVGKTQQAEELKQVIIRKAKDLGLDLSVEVQSYTVGNFQ
jgi:hypothetical protein